jgi:nitrite reductase/ring-hydroxylating ferredoxin subunit
MKENMLEYTREEISRLSDDRLDQAWKKFMAFAGETQRLREEVQRMLRKKSPAQKVKAEDIPEGGMAVTKAGEKEVLLAKVQGEIYAIDNACGHSGYPLHQGKLDGYVVTCRWHDAKFDVRSGAVLAPGRDFRPIKRFRVAADVNGAVIIGEEL